MPRLSDLILDLGIIVTLVGAAPMAMSASAHAQAADPESTLSVTQDSHGIKTSDTTRLFYDAREVDRPVEVIGCARSKPVREGPGVYTPERRVELQYVVDTLGRAEPTSLTLVQQQNGTEEVLHAALEMIRSCRYRPARVAGRPVRQLVQQAVVFPEQGLKELAPDQPGQLPW